MRALSSEDPDPDSQPKGEWIEAGHLQVGDQLRTATGTWVAITDIKAGGSVEWAYNFEVAENHSYVVGGRGVVVHNTQRPDCPPAWAQDDIEALNEHLIGLGWESMRESQRRGKAFWDVYGGINQDKGTAAEYLYFQHIRNVNQTLMQNKSRYRVVWQPTIDVQSKTRIRNKPLAVPNKPETVHLRTSKYGSRRLDAGVIDLSLPMVTNKHGHSFNQLVSGFDISFQEFHTRTVNGKQRGKLPIFNRYAIFSGVKLFDVRFHRKNRVNYVFERF